MFNLSGNRKEQEEQVKSAGRLPPGQALAQKFPVLHGPVPPFSPATGFSPAWWKKNADVGQVITDAAS
jgi:hypothetical protein